MWNHQKKLQSILTLYLKTNFTSHSRIVFVSSYRFSFSLEKKKNRKEKKKKISRLDQLHLIFIYRIVHFYNPSITRRIGIEAPMKPDIDSNSKHARKDNKKGVREEWVR